LIGILVVIEIIIICGGGISMKSYTSG